MINDRLHPKGTWLNLHRYVIAAQEAQLAISDRLPSSSRRHFCLRRRAAGSAEGMPVLMRTGEIGDGARQQYALNPDAQLNSSAGFVA